MNISRNEVTDIPAIDATIQDETRHCHSPHNLLKSARKRTFKAAGKTEWARACKNGKRNLKAHAPDHQKLNVDKGPKVYSSISRKTKISYLARLRTGRSPLGRYLRQFNIPDSPLSDCGSGVTEIVKRYSLMCRKCGRERVESMRNVGIDGIRIEKLLDYPKLINRTLEYVENTKE